MRHRDTISVRSVVLVGLCTSFAACTTEFDPGSAMGAELVHQEANEEALTTTCAPGATVKGIDVSLFQGTVDWSAVKNDGVKYAFIRVSDGVNTPDELFSQNWSGARAAGVRRGAYQFFRPSQDAIAQADLLVDAIGSLEAGDLPPVLDLESMSGQSAATVRTRAQQWLARVEERLGVKPILYTGPYFWRDNVGAPSFGANYPLWIAHYTSGCPLVPEPWSMWRFHQFSDSGEVAGIDGPVDINRFNGSEADLALLAFTPSSSSNPATCVEAENAVAGDACASGCIWSVWSVTNGIQPGTHECAGQACACVEAGNAQSACAVQTCDDTDPLAADPIDEPTLTVLSPASGAVVANPVTFALEGSGIQTVKILADQWEILSFHPATDGWTHTYAFQTTGVPRVIRVRGFAPNGLPVVDFTFTITVQAPALGGTTPTSHLTTRAGRAATILTHHEAAHLTLWNQSFGSLDGADPLSNITDTKNGVAAKTSCHGTAPCTSVTLQLKLLTALQKLREQYGYQYFVTSIAGASHSAGSLHYQGRAFDIDEINGVLVKDASNAVINTFLDRCEALGAVEVFGPTNDPGGHFDHIHCAF